MKIQEFYTSNSSRSILDTDKAMQLQEKIDRQKLEVSQLKRKVREDAKIDLDLSSDKKPSVSYNKNLYDEFRRKSAILRNLEDKLTQLDLKFLCRLPILVLLRLGLTKVEIMVFLKLTSNKIDEVQNRLLKRRKYNIQGVLERGNGSMD